MDDAIKCKHCGSILNNNSATTVKTNTTAYSGLLGAFIAIFGLLVSVVGGISTEGIVLPILGIIIIIYGASLGAKNK